MSKEVAKTGNKEVSTEVEMDLASWGQSEISQKDVIIPKVLTMQGLSEMVTDGKAQMGEFRSSLTGELLGSVDKPMEFVPVLLVKTWIIFKMNGKGQFEFSKIVPMDKDNEDWDWESTDEMGNPIRRDRTLNFYVLRVADIAEKNPVPYVLSFRRTSARAGKKLATQMYMLNANAGKNPAAKVMKLSGRREKNDQGTYIVTDVEASRESTKEEQMAAFELLKAVKTQSTKVDDSDISNKGDF